MEAAAEEEEDAPPLPPPLAPPLPADAAAEVAAPRDKRRGRSYRLIEAVQVGHIR